MILNLPQIWLAQPKHLQKVRKFRPLKPSIRTERWYQRELLGFVKAIRKEVESVIEDNSNLNHAFLFADSQDKPVRQELMQIIQRLIERKIDQTAERISSDFVQRSNQQNEQEQTTLFKQAIGIDLNAMLKASPKVAQKVEIATKANVELIKSIRSQYLDKVQTAVTQALMRGVLNKELTVEIKKIGNVTENRAKFIARDQTSKLNAALTRARHEDVGVTKYRWSTSGDERVRDTHVANDGKVFAYADPPEMGNPGDDYNCRCVAIPIFDYNVKTAKEEEAEARNAEQKEAPQAVVEPKVEKPKPTQKPNNLPISETTIELIQDLKNANVEHRPVQLLKEKLPFDKILAKLAGGDETGGSCASLALAYIGNKVGLDVTDYRGGKSREFFSIKGNTRKLFSASGIKTTLLDVKRETKETADILNTKLELNKEYYLSTGRHAAIVRLTNNGLEYLEMQSSVKNGWMSFNRYGSVAKTLQKRFGCRVSANKYGFTSKVLLAEVDSFKSRKLDLKEIFGYLNTATDDQKKGSKGGEK